MMKKQIILLIAIFTTATCRTGFAQSGYGKTGITDLVLLYQAGLHRSSYEWTKERLLPYVVHTDQKGKKSWLFDGFLFLEFKDGKGYHYAPGYDKLNARKPEWEWLISRQLEKGTAISALNTVIEEQIAGLGKPHFKHKLVLGIPSPILNQADWGSVDGQVLDFKKQEDRITAGKWYVDELLRRYEQEHYEHVKLEGLYWVDESTKTCADILGPLGDYIRSKGLKFYWIPYWKAYGYDKWKEYRFDFAYLQPNHFFDGKIDHDRLDQACAAAKSLGMGVEMEFDDRALASSKDQFAYRLKAYIDKFRENNVFRDSPIAYYQGGATVYSFYKSSNPADKQLMDELATEIIKRKNKRLMRKLRQ